MLRIEGIDQYYCGSHILRGVSLEVPRAGVTALLGRSTRELAAERGAGYDRTVVHRDALVLLP